MVSQQQDVPPNTMPVQAPNTSVPQPKAKLLSIEKVGECDWTVSFLLEDSTPNSEIMIESEGELAKNCDPAKKETYSWSVDSGYTTDEYGQTVISYTQNDYGDYTYTFTDEDSYKKSVSFLYNLTTPLTTGSPTPTVSVIR